jgi:LPS export ABC transporter protein LptC
VVCETQVRLTMKGLFSKIWIKAAVVLGCYFFLWSCENDERDIRALTDKKTSVEVAHNIESYLSQSGKVKARLTSPLMNRFQTDSPYVEFPKSLHVDFYNDSLKVESQLSALYGRYRESENKVYLKDSVIVFNIKGDTLRCEELWWDQQRQVFYTNKPARVNKPNNTVIIGVHGIEAKQDLSEYTFFNTSGHVPVSNSGILQ